jgi:hypothetical protein
MIFGDIADFAIEAQRDPVACNGVWGRMCVHVQGLCFGDIHEKNCALYPATKTFRRLYPTIEDLWDPSLDGLPDAGIFSLIDLALYIGDDPGWNRYGRFDFLTQGGESFREKTFIVCRPDKRVHFLYQLRDGTSGSVACHADAFRAAIGSYLAWFDGQDKGPNVRHEPRPRPDPKSDYWTLLKSIAASTSEATQRRIACAFCRLIWDSLPEEGKAGLLVAEDYARNAGDRAACEHQKQILQSMLPGGGKSVPISAVIWALQESDGSYPAWYAASIAGSNLETLNAATGEQLCSIVSKIVAEEQQP